VRKKLLYAFFILCYSQCYAQSFPNLKFSHLTEKDGLTNNTVRSVTQDAEGFMWFGTDNGLNRFDGYRIKQFYHKPADTNSLVNNQVMQIAPDKKNNVWVSTAEGLSLFSRQENYFINFRHKDGDASSLISDHNNGLLVDDENNVWATVHGGLCRFSEQQQFKYITLNTKHSSSKSQVQIFGLYADIQKQYWAYAENNLFKLNDNKIAVDTFSTPSGFITSFYEDSKGNYWAATFQNGLYKFNKITGNFTSVSSITSTITIFSITEWKDKNNFSWIVLGADNGLILYNPVTQKSFEYTHDALNNTSVSGNAVYKVFIDEQNILWVATNKGVSYIEPSKQIIETWSIPSVQKNNYSEDRGYMYSFFEDDNSYLMTNWSQPGLCEFDTSGTLIKTIPSLYPQGNDTLRNRTTQAFCIIKDKQKNYWYSTDAGLVEFNGQQKSYHLYQPPDKNVFTGFRNIAQLNDSIWYIRTRNNGPNGIYVFNVNQKKFIAHYYYVEGCKNCLPQNLLALIITKKGEIFTSPRYNRLYRYDKNADVFVPENINNLNVNISNTFECLAEDETGNIWIGTANGLLEYNPISKKIISDYTANKIIGGVEIIAICLDEDNNIWMNTENGLYCLLRDKKNIFNFNTGDGLPNNSLQGFLVKGKNGYMYCGAENYVVKFNPKKLLQNNSFNINTFFSEAEAENKNLLFNISGNNEKKITLKPGENVFSVDFAVLNFDNAESNRYFYKLDGAINEWKENDNGHLTFYNLSPGNYTLHVQGANKYSKRFTGEDELMIEVQPHWWQTLWFKLLAIIIVAILAAMLIRRRFQQIRKAAELKQKIAETEMIALRAQMNPHFIFNCLNSIDNLIQTNEKEKATTYLSKFAKLIRAILENSKHNTVPCWKDLETLKLYLELEELRWGKKISYTLNIAPEILQGDYKVPPMIIQPYVENAIHHGLLNKEKGSRHLLVEVKAEKNHINYLIEDNGIGRKKAMEYKLLNKSMHQSMGLDITKERVNLFNQNNNGSITITDLYNEYKEASGTRVTVSLINQ
jgi:ligand-binding sensor domain-containing protein